MQFSPISSQFTIIMLDTEWSKSISMSQKSYPHHCNTPKPSIGFWLCLPSQWTTVHPFMDGSHVTFNPNHNYSDALLSPPLQAAADSISSMATNNSNNCSHYHHTRQSSWYIRCCPPCISIVLCLIIGNKNWNRNPTPRNKVSSLLPSSAPSTHSL